ncbi:MAG: type II secretion system F family protein [Candidatus Aenigmarchaeota archaeon]|nr:type II secretion system F family protein [Candidatus Aenigmarchaeota archaeon]
MYKPIVRILGQIVITNAPKFSDNLRMCLQKADVKALYEIYIGKMVFFSIVTFFAVFFSTFINGIIIGADIFILLLNSISTSSILAFLVAAAYNYYPRQIIATKKNNIEGNMPFAVNHMAAIASSGVPPFIIFKLISNVPEYGQITNEMKRIVRNIEVFGMDMVSGIKNVADRTPSIEFSQFLYSVISNIETGGDIRRFFDNYARETMLNYRIKRDKYIKTLSTYADFYTAVLIAAPLFFISILSIMAIIGGSVFGLDIATAMSMGVYILIPLLNVLFLLFINYTQPVI